MPDGAAGSDGTLAQILLKMGEMNAKLAVMDSKLDAIPDHESRIRSLEKWRYSLPAAFLLSVASIVVGAYGFITH